MTTRRHFSGAALSATASLYLGLAAKVGAQEKFPSKPIRIVYPAAPGVGVESLIRLIGSKMSEQFGQPVLLENRPGANAQIGIAHVAKSAPDGYTLGVGYVTNLALAPHIYKTLPYDPLKDITPIGLIAENYLALVVQPNAPITSANDISKWAKAKPNGLSLGLTSVGGLPHLAFEQLAHKVDIKPFTVVSYNGNSQLLQDLIGGRLDIAMVDYSGAQPFIDAGTIKLVGITYPTRDSRLPKLPTLAESVKGYESVGWFGLVCAARTPEPIVESLNQALVAALAQPDVQKSMQFFGLLPAPGSSKYFATRLKSENDKYAELAKQIGFKPL